MLLLIAALLASLLLVAPVSLAQQASEPACPLPPGFAPDRDYFPDKATVDSASGFTIEYKPSQKIVTVTGGLSYILNLCSAPAIANPPATTKVINIPVAVAASESQTALDSLFSLGVGHLVKFATPFDNPVIPCAQAAKANNSLAELTTTTPETSYNVLFTPSVGADRRKAVNIPLPNVDATPLQKAEWIKLFAAFFNLEKEANAMYKSIVDAYECRKRQVAGVATPKPIVAWIEEVDPVSSPGSWKVNQGIYARTLIADAGGVPLVSPTNVPTSELLKTLSTAHVVIDATPRSKNMELIQWLRLVGKASVQEISAPFAQRKHLYAVDHNVDANGHDEFRFGHTLRPGFVLQDIINVLYPIAQGTSYSRRYLRNMITDEGFSQRLDAAMCTAPLNATSPLLVVPSNANECRPNVPEFTGSSSVMLGGDSTNSDQGKNEPPKRGASAGVIFGAIVAVVLIAGFIVFVAPKLARRYREHKNRQYMQEML